MVDEDLGVGAEGAADDQLREGCFEAAHKGALQGAGAEARVVALGNQRLQGLRRDL